MTSDLLRTPCSDWITAQAVIIDWHDGPLSGFCCLNQPKVEFYFTAIAEIPCQNDVDIRLHEVASIDVGSVETIVNKLSFLGKPKDAVWAPVWNRDTNKNKCQNEIDSFFEQIIAKALPGGIVLASRDLKNFSAVWNVKNSMATVTDWIAYIKHVNPVSFNSKIWPPENF